MKTENTNPDSALSFTATAENFSELVLGNSHNLPVLLNFRSPKVEVCQQQLPILEKLAQTYSGRFLLVNVDMDSQQQLVKAQGVTTVPTLKLLVEEEVVAGLNGFQSEADLQYLLDQYVAKASDLGVAEALQVYSSGEKKAALLKLAEVAMEDPGNYKVPVVMAKMLQREGRLKESLQLLGTLPEEVRFNEEVSAMTAELSFLQIAQQAASPQDLVDSIKANENDLEARFHLAAHAVAAQQFEPAMGQFLEIMRRDREYLDDIGRLSLLSMLKIVRKDEELVNSYREKMRQLLQ